MMKNNSKLEAYQDVINEIKNTSYLEEWESSMMIGIVNNLILRESFEQRMNTSDKLILTDSDKVSLQLFSHKSSWKENKNSEEIEPLMLKLDSDSVFNTVLLTKSSMIKLRDYLSEKIDYLEESSNAN